MVLFPFSGFLFKNNDQCISSKGRGDGRYNKRRSSYFLQRYMHLLQQPIEPITDLLIFPFSTLPATSTTIKHHAHEHALTPRDYLNASQTDPAPFEFCPVFGPGDPVAERRGQYALLKSRLHTGSNARIQRVVQKALSGSPITISVLGGSGTLPPPII